VVVCSAWDLKKYGPEQINHLKQTLELTCDRQIAVEPMVDPRVEALGEALDASIGSFKQMCASALTVGLCSVALCGSFHRIPVQYDAPLCASPAQAASAALGWSAQFGVPVANRAQLSIDSISGLIWSGDNMEQC
jgi:hypothetical protein